MFFSRFKIPDIESLKKKRDLLGLIKALKHPRSIETRIAAVYALKKDERALIPLAEAALKDPHESVKLAALEVLRGLTWPMHHRLEVERDPKKIIPILMVLTRLRDESTLPSILKHLDSEHEGIREAAVDALATICDLKAMEALVRAYERETSKRLKERIADLVGSIRERS